MNRTPKDVKKAVVRPVEPTATVSPGGVLLHRCGSSSRPTAHLPVAIPLPGATLFSIFITIAISVRARN